MKLRPHHLLCTQGYSGRGYSPEFIFNMNAITKRLRSEEDIIIELVFSTDDICAKCPKMLRENLCESQGHVKLLDQKMVDSFGLKEKHYAYQELVAQINSKMTEAMIDYICSECQWYSVSACKENIVNA